MRSIYLGVVFFLFPNSAWSTEKTPWHTYVHAPFIIYFDQQDSCLAKTLPIVLAPKLADIYLDLVIQSSSHYSIVIAPSKSDYQNYLKTGLPSWTGAFAVPALKTLVVKSPHWDRPESDLKKNLLHELAHLVLHERVGYQPLPRWLDEGLALFYEEPKAWDYPAALSKALFTHSLIPLEQIDEVLSFQKDKANLAYQQSYSAVIYFLGLYDIDGLRIVLDGFRHRRSMDDIFTDATGSRFAAFEKEWQTDIQRKFKYNWFSEWDTFIWLFILLLSILAVIWIRRRNRQTRQQWELATPTRADLPPPDKAESDSTINDSFIEKDIPDA